MDGRTTDGRTPDHGHPISSPCEPNGSGELKRYTPAYPSFTIQKWGIRMVYIIRTCFPDECKALLHIV